MGLGNDEEILVELVKMASISHNWICRGSIFCTFLNEASLQFMGDLIDAEDEGDVKWDIGVPGVVWGL